MTNGTNPAPQQGFGQGWSQPMGQGGQAPQFPQHANPANPAQPAQPVGGFGQNQFGGPRPFQQGGQTDPSQMTTDEADTIAAARDEKVQQTEQRRSRIWSKILGVIGFALLIACIMIVAWTFIPDPPIDPTAAAPLQQADTHLNALGVLPGQDL